MSVFFSDVAGFTSVAESLSPEELTELLNSYLSEMTAIIFDHGGTVDKYIGDAIVAFWNAPLDQPDHATFVGKGGIDRVGMIVLQYAFKKFHGTALVVEPAAAFRITPLDR